MPGGEKPIVVTGAAGFIGSCFVESCNARGIPCVSVDRLDHFAERPEHRRIAMGEILELDSLLDWLKTPANKPRAIVHLGACTDTMEMDVAVHERLNVAYSQALWRYAVQAGVPFVYASSAATYGDGSQGYLDDEARISELRPLNPYGESKQRFDLFALAEESRGAAPPAWSGFKFFNVYGFGERHKGRMASVVLHAFDQIRASGRVRLFRSYRPDVADGHQVRDFVFVRDVVDVLHFALEQPIRRGIYNLGTGASRTFLDLALATFAALGREPDIEFIEMPAELRSRYQYFTEARMEKLRAAGFTRPFASLEEGVKEYVQQLARE